MADRAFVDRIAALTAEQQSAFSFWMGPIALDFSAFVGKRLNEHALHSRDIDITFNASATVPENAATLIVDNLEMITRYTGKPDSTERVVTVRTSAPVRTFAISRTANAASLGSTAGDDAADLELPAEAFVRLVYGRLGSHHTPVASMVRSCRPCEGSSAESENLRPPGPSWA